MSARDVHVAVIGGGLVGLGSAYAIQRSVPGAIVTVLEKEAQAGAHQSTHNSGVLHAGLYYTPGSRKAQLAVSGIRSMTAFAAAHGVAHEVCGKVVVAASADEVPRLRKLLERGTANGLRGLTWLDAAAVHEREPYVQAVGAVLVPEEGIIDYAGVVRALVGEIERAGGAVHVSSPVTAARRDASGWVLQAGDAELRADFVLNCAGLQSDRVARLLGADPATHIVPFRGEYFTIADDRAFLVRHLVYPVPDPAFPFLGVHFTRMIHGGVECGPNAVLALDREGYRRLAFRAVDAADALGFAGLWQFIRRHTAPTVRELYRSLSKTAFLRSLQRLVPDLTLDDLRPGLVGVRAQAMRSNGTLVEDFDFVDGPASLHVLNAPSPAATAALAIGEEIAQRVAARLGDVVRPAAMGAVG